MRLDHEFSDDTNEVREVEQALITWWSRPGPGCGNMGRAARRVAVVTVDYSDGARMIRQRSHSPGTANDFLLFDLARAALASAWTRRVRIRHLRYDCATGSPIRPPRWSCPLPRTRPRSKSAARTGCWRPWTAYAGATDRA